MTASAELLPNLVDDDVPRRIASPRTATDRIYRGVATSAGMLTLVVLVLIGLFLFKRALPALQLNGWSFLTSSVWQPDSPTHETGVAALVIGTIQIASIALVLAVPICILAALFLTDYAPRAFRRPLTTLIDLLAAIPAVIYGAWGFFFLQPKLLPVSAWLSHNLGFIPLFSVTAPRFAGSPFITAVVVSLMMLPTATSVMREVFARAPEGEKEAALALGGSRWRMVRTVVLPFGKSGIVGATMLALGRAFGEAISVSMIISLVPDQVNRHILETGGSSIGALIATRFGDSTPQYGIPALIGAGLVLFVMTLLVNLGASRVVRRARGGGPS